MRRDAIQIVPRAPILADRRAVWRSSRLRVFLVAVCAATLALAGSGPQVSAEEDPPETEPKRPKKRPKRPKKAPKVPKDGKGTDVLPKEGKGSPAPGGGAGEPPLPEGLGEGDRSKEKPGQGPGTDEPPLPDGLKGPSDGGKEKPGPGKATDEPPLPDGLKGPSDGRKEKPDQRKAADEPPLPDGLKEEGSGADEPPLPSGLDDAGKGASGEPNLPEGLGGGGSKTNEKPTGAGGLRLPKIAGFGEYRGGVRVLEDPFQDARILNEGRLHLETEFVLLKKLTLRAGGDFKYDGEDESELREASASLTPLPFLDIKVGRQILSWGTSTSLFINDLFPKDFFAFLTGRGIEQVKAPSDALKVSIFALIVNLDAVYVPKFNPDRFLTGDRLSLFNPLMQRISGRDAILTFTTPDERFEDDELHLRMSRLVGTGELAVYGYRGFWKSPAGFDPMTMQFTFPRLEVYGASLRDSLGTGIGHIEAGYYNSLDDPDGDNPLVNNSELRIIAGYEWGAPQIASDLTLGLDYYVERITDYDKYRATLPPGSPRRAEYRYVVVAQIVKLLYRQNITFQLYGYVSPSDYDGYLRSSLDLRLSDQLTATAGANLFYGLHDYTFYGQLETNSNVYAALRAAF